MKFGKKIDSPETPTPEERHKKFLEIISAFDNYMNGFLIFLVLFVCLGDLSSLKREKKELEIDLKTEREFRERVGGVLDGLFKIVKKGEEGEVLRMRVVGTISNANLLSRMVQRQGIELPPETLLMFPDGSTYHFDGKIPLLRKGDEIVIVRDDNEKGDVLWGEVNPSESEKV